MQNNFGWVYNGLLCREINTIHMFLEFILSRMFVYIRMFIKIQPRTLRTAIALREYCKFGNDPLKSKLVSLKKGSRWSLFSMLNKHFIFPQVESPDLNYHI